ncbi:MAG: hypothetical protein AB9919_04940 [Geobacteraceae bacterium]
MRDFSAESRKTPEISATAPGIDDPLWLLQKDETRFLYFSLVLSVTVHIILFAVMAATRIFHPFAGASQEFDLVWFSPAPAAVPIAATMNKPAALNQAPVMTAQPPPKPGPRSTPTATAPAAIQPLPPDTTKAPPTGNPPQASPAMAEVRGTPTEQPAEMVISRFSGKVVEVVDKKANNPAFSVISSVKMKSKNARTVVKTIRETEAEPQKMQESKLSVNQAEKNIPAALPKNKIPGKPSKAITVVTAAANQPTMAQGTDKEKAVQRKVSSASIATAGKKPVTLSAVNRSINSFAAALETLSAIGNKQAALAQASQKQINGVTGTGPDNSPKRPAEAKAPTRPPTVEKKAPPAEKPVPPPTPPQLILHPPVAGDLKLIITGDIDLKVEIYFRPFLKTRRSKPFTRREAENRRNIIPKLVRTRENVHEAVVEVAEEGIYSIMVQVNNGKPGTAGLVLKIRDSRPGASSQDLGSRKIDGIVEVAKVLMPEGILWSDNGYFTGDMEDADSITKFNSGTGLMWREYK